MSFLSNFMLSFSFFFLMIRRPPRSTLSSSSAASDVYKRQIFMVSEGMNADRPETPVDPAQLHERGDILGSPRCKEAMARTGIVRADLRPRDLASFRPGTHERITQEQQKMRYEHYEERRVAKAASVLKARDKVMAEEQAGVWPPYKPEHGAEHLSTMILQERERVEASKNKIQERHEQLKAHEARLAEEKTVQLALIAAAEERGRELRLIAREEAVKAEAEREARVAAQRAEGQARARRHQQELQAKAAHEEHREAERKARIDQVNRERSERRAIKRQESRKRIQSCLQQDQALLQAKRDRYSVKQQQLEARAAEAEKLAAIEHEGAAQLKQERTVRVEAAQQREKHAQSQRKAELQAHHKSIDARLSAKSLEDDEERQQRDEALRLKQEHQTATREEAHSKKMSIRRERLEKRSQKEELYNELCKQRAHEQMLQAERRLLKQWDGQDFRAQHERVEEHRRKLRLAQIHEDTAKYRASKAELQELLQQRAINRDQVAMAREPFVDSSPGPGEYNPLLPEAAAPKFGLKLGPVSSGFNDTPAPDQYNPDTNMLFAHSGAHKFSTDISKTALESYVCYYGQLPGPTDYNTSGELKRGPYMGSGDLIGPLEHRLKAAAGVPAPDHYSLYEAPGKGTTFGKAPLPNPENGEQRANPGPGAYELHMEAVWGKSSNPRCDTVGDKSYLNEIETIAARTPGPGTYNVNTAAVSMLNGELSVTEAYKFRNTGRISAPPTEHKPLDCAQFGPSGGMWCPTKVTKPGSV
eukprot:TRINITY_DN38330_c0_g1_i2.p1 TRINITY_DN38330_c0_g1~~TRINITY_DN38330_c0_g1_i2.p1  ORF type:complete len:760 (-),score=205.61 TRINITY_DN38330_c0_g1_i2:140-2419(-)